MKNNFEPIHSILIKECLLKVLFIIFGGMHIFVVNFHKCTLLASLFLIYMQLIVLFCLNENQRKNCIFTLDFFQIHAFSQIPPDKRQSPEASPRLPAQAIGSHSQPTLKPTTSISFSPRQEQHPSADLQGNARTVATHIQDAATSPINEVSTQTGKHVEMVLLS